MNTDERRYTGRYNLKIPLSVQLSNESGGPLQSLESANVSARGIYFGSRQPFAVGTPLQIAFRMPEEISGETSPEWNCRCRVVRSEDYSESSGLSGIAVEILYYEISDHQGSGSHKLKALTADLDRQPR